MVINVIAGAETVLGGGSEPGYLEGYGVIDAEQVRQLAQDASLRLVEDPTVSDAEALRYQPSAAVERAVRLRDLTCRFPGCDRPAVVCDLDHTVAFNHADPRKGGLTVAHNLKCLCRQHHRLKTFHDGWRDEQLPDGTVIWTSPTGEIYRTVPGGVELFPDMGSQSACREPKPVRRNRSRERAARIARIRIRNRIQRPINEAHRRLQQARRREIDYRRTRNRMRKTLFLLKGGPSTSPFCSWVNEPTRTRRAATRLATATGTTTGARRSAVLRISTRPYLAPWLPRRETRGPRGDVAAVLLVLFAIRLDEGRLLVPPDE